MIHPMSEISSFQAQLPSAADSALEIIRALRAAGFEALLAGGCVRDLLLGLQPQDYDVATDCPPQRICELFPKTRKVGVHFGVVLVGKRRKWIEVATFRSDGAYLDGRRPMQVHFSDARRDAQRRDFTVNGMFLDTLAMNLIDYVGGRDDLQARRIRAIGDPAARFAEDHLRLIRAVRFAARLEFDVEADTRAAVVAHADKLAEVAAERVREELEKMLKHPTRVRAFDLLDECGLLPYLWPGADWPAPRVRAARERLAHLPAEASFPLVCAVLLADRPRAEVNRISRALACSNEQRETAAWLIEHHRDLDDPAGISLAALKRLLAHPAFDDLRVWAEARYSQLPGAAPRASALNERIAGIAPEAVQPPPFVTGDDLAQLGITPGPIYKEILDELYTRQLNEVLADRSAALEMLERLLQARPSR